MRKCLLLAFAIAACARPSPGPTRDAATIRVMTWNIEAGAGHLDSIGEVIAALRPDIAALQEVDVHWSARSQFADQASTLAARLGMQARFAYIYSLAPPAQGAPRREFGVAILSRFPITAFRNDTITRLSTQDSTAGPAPAPGLLDATIDVRGAPVRVFDTHLDYRSDPRVRVRQVADMLAFIGDASRPTIVFGDLNASPEAPELAPLLGRLSNAWAQAGSGSVGLTYPAAQPVKRIDYVLVSSHFRTRSAVVPVTSASDHRPVVFQLELRPPR